jgi:hypothetical protein
MCTVGKIKCRRQKERETESRMWRGHSVGGKIFILESYQIEDKYW